MHSSWQKVDAVMPFFGVGAAVHSLIVSFEDRLHDIVGIIVVVSILGSLIQEPLAEGFMTFIILL
jgi:hypothetical protein